MCDIQDQILMSFFNTRKTNPIQAFIPNYSNGLDTAGRKVTEPDVEIIRAQSPGEAKGLFKNYTINTYLQTRVNVMMKKKHRPCE